MFLVIEVWERELQSVQIAASLDEAVTIANNTIWEALRKDNGLDDEGIHRSIYRGDTRLAGWDENGEFNDNAWSNEGDYDYDVFIYQPQDEDEPE